MEQEAAYFSPWAASCSFVGNNPRNEKAVSVVMERKIHCA
jgi:hypothetical protein